MRFRRVLIPIGALVLIICLWRFYSARQYVQRRDISMAFLGLTNDPGSSVPQLWVLGNGRGLHARFAATNTNQFWAVQFGISAVETQGHNSGSSRVFPSGFSPAAADTPDADGWSAAEAGGFPTAPLGLNLAPGHSQIIAMPWPSSLPTNTIWRLRFWVMREPARFESLVNQRFGREVFHPHGHHTVKSEIVE